MANLAKGSNAWVFIIHSILLSTTKIQLGVLSCHVGDPRACRSPLGCSTITTHVNPDIFASDTAKYTSLLALHGVSRELSFFCVHITLLWAWCSANHVAMDGDGALRYLHTLWIGGIHRASRCRYQKNRYFDNHNIQCMLFHARSCFTLCL